MADQMQQLIENGSTGLDLSPGDPTAAWAVQTITELRARIAQLESERCEYIKANAGLAAENQWLDSSEREWIRKHVEVCAENQRLRADGERLDWLCDHADINYDHGGLRSFEWHADVTVRSAIEAARGK